MNALQAIYNSKWFPRLFYRKPDGGKDSGVTGYFLIEWKPLFSIGLLHFKKGSREAFHNHAFNAITFWLKGSAIEEKHPTGQQLRWAASLLPKYTPRENCHRIVADDDVYALTFRGPWNDTWFEFKNDRYITLTHGRKVVSVSSTELKKGNL